MEVFIGTIQPFAFPFAPRGWMLCNGQILSIASNTALFSLLGTTYGGNGTTTFALPNLQGRVAISQGQSPGTSTYVMGEMSGTESVTLLQSNMPAHNHMLQASTAAGASVAPSGAAVLAAANGEDEATLAAVKVQVYGPGPANTTLSPQAISIAGSSMPMSIMQPFLTVNFCIAVQGIFPSRN